MFAFRDIGLLQKRIILTFQEKKFSQPLTKKIGVNGIFYKVEEETEQYIDECSGHLIVTCVVGKTNIQIQQKSFKRCISKYYIYSK